MTKLLLPQVNLTSLVEIHPISSQFLLLYLNSILYFYPHYLAANIWVSDSSFLGVRDTLIGFSVVHRLICKLDPVVLSGSVPAMIGA
jgi:hypothetical protein